MNELQNLIENVRQLISVAQKDWGSLHPLFVHFPIALFFVAPLFIVLGLVFSKSRKIFYLLSLILIWSAVGFAFLSVETGELASEFLEPNTAVGATLKMHAELAEKSRLIFLILAFVFTCHAVFIFLNKNLSPALHTIILALFFISYAYGLLMLFNAVHQGGKLVHQHGIHSNFYRNIPNINKSK